MSETELLAKCTAAAAAVRDAKATKTGDVKALVGALLAAKEEYKVYHCFPRTSVTSLLASSTRVVVKKSIFAWLITTTTLLPPSPTFLFARKPSVFTRPGCLADLPGPCVKLLVMTG